VQLFAGNPPADGPFAKSQIVGTVHVCISMEFHRILGRYGLPEVWMIMAWVLPQRAGGGLLLWDLVLLILAMGPLP